MGEATLRVRQGSLPGIGQEHATAGVAVGAYQPHNGGASPGGFIGPTCAQGRGVVTTTPRRDLGPHGLPCVHRKNPIGSSYVSYNSHGLVCATCITLFRGSLALLLAEGLKATSFQTTGGTVYSPKELRDSFPNLRGIPSETREVLSARPLVDDYWAGLVADNLRDRLGSHIDVGTDRIGHSFVALSDGGKSIKSTSDHVLEVETSSSLYAFARSLIRAAAILGPDEADRLVSQWANGQPRHFKIMLVLVGVYIDKCIELDQGLRIFRLPLSSDSLPISMPDMPWHSVGGILGHAVLELEAFSNLPLFAPTRNSEGYPESNTREPLNNVIQVTYNSSWGFSETLEPDMGFFRCTQGSP